MTIHKNSKYKRPPSRNNILNPSYTQQLRTRSRNPRKSKPKVVRKSKGIIRCTPEAATEPNCTIRSTEVCDAAFDFRTEVPDEALNGPSSVSQSTDCTTFDLFSGGKKFVSRRVWVVLAKQKIYVNHDVDPVLLPFGSSYSSSRWFLHDREYTARMTCACKTERSGR